MAENKKSFIAYSEWNEIFKKLTDDEAGKLAKMMFSYVSDENPEAPDRITELLFEQIKLHLKRDLKKYEGIKEKRAEAGRNGGLKSGEVRSKTTKNEANEANASVGSKNEANEAVNDNGNVNDNVNDIIKEEYKALPFPFLNSLLDLGAEKQIAIDWLKVRKTKKATNTETAFKGFKTELEKSGNGINEVLKICVENSWAGFKTEWIANKIKPAEIPGETSEERTRRLYVESMKNGKIKMNY